MTFDLQAALRVALAAVDVSGHLVRAAFGKGGTACIKSDDSVVTETDRAVERTIREALVAAYPEHGVLGEEFGGDFKTQPWCWVIDPIDGTVSFINGLPFAGTLVALCHQGKPVLAVVDFPLGKRAWAIAGQGAWQDGVRLRVRESFDPARDVVCHSDFYTFEMSGYESAYRAIEAGCRHFRSYTDAFGHHLVATGAAAAVVDAAMEVWDVVAVRLLVEEAGGLALSFPDHNDAGRVLLVSGTPAAVNWLAPIVQSSLEAFDISRSVNEVTDYNR